MLDPIRTLKELNEANAHFWRIQRVAFYERMADPAISEAASEAWRAQQCRSVPPASQFSLETALEDAERSFQIFSKQRARQGGIVPKADSLQLLIETIVRHRLDISENQLLEKLRVYQTTRFVVQDIEDGFILFTSNSGKLSKDKKAPVSELKDRLARAKKKVKSR
jgi:hypothetical protein